jgi:hypothetical protein
MATALPAAAQPYNGERSHSGYSAGGYGADGGLDGGVGGETVSPAVG